jgi:putative ABC transport system permease protein
MATVGGLLGGAIALAGAGRLAGAAATALGTTSPQPGPSVLVVLGGLVAAAGVAGALATRRTAGAGIAGLSAGASPARPSAAAARALAAGLPAPAALAAKEVGASRARALSTVLAVALAVTATVAALGMEATFRASRDVSRAAAPAVPLASGAVVDDESGLRTLVYGLQGLLGVVALASISAVGLVGLRERRRELAVLSAVGFTVRQLAASTVAAQAVLAGLGALAGIPLGMGFFRLAYGLANGSSAGLVDAPPAQLAAVVPAAMLVAALVAAVPGTSLRRLPVSAALAPA